jgi:hypothetical protein
VIAASGILVIVAFVTLIVGVFRTGLSLIWASIAASILAAIFLALGVVQGNKRRVIPASGTSGATVQPWSEAAPSAPMASTAVLERAPSPSADDMIEEMRPPLTAVPEPETQSFAPAPRQTAPAMKAPAAAKPATRKAATSSQNVVVVPDRDKYHKETCRYAKNPAAMTMTKAAARRQGYTACGTCKP